MSEAPIRARFSTIRYAQCWEDADVLVAALDPQPGHACVSIASAGDNTLALLSRDPASVLAVDINAAQLACLELRVAAYQALEHSELLELLGSRPSMKRTALYQRCRKLLSPNTRYFWDSRSDDIERGFGSAGKFERYFEIFRTRILPLVHSQQQVARLLGGGEPARREAFYARQWDTWRWRLLFRLFFSKFVMGRLGRDPAFFHYVKGNVAERILARTKYALTALDPVANPYLQWVLTGTHTTALPFALRPENFELIRRNLPRLEWTQANLEQMLSSRSNERFDRFNLSDIFEYMSSSACARLLERIIDSSRPGARLAYWNMLVPRRRPESLSNRLHPREKVAKELFAGDKAWFYSAFVLEEVPV